MRLLVVGGGGREHALCWALARSATVFCAPGNPGTAALGTNIPLDPEDLDAVADAVAAHRIDLTVVGPEAPLAAGLVDHLNAAGRHAFGPTAAAARLEASKSFAKRLMTEAAVPTAHGESFSDQARALSYISAHPEPLVVKASGLAAGKGVIICDTRKAAATAAREIFGGRFGKAGQEVVVEEFLEGEELSVLALTDGEQTLLLTPSQDHKRIGEGDTGPNTGGMGAYAPVSIADDDLLDRIEAEIIQPTLRAMAHTGAPYRGVLYAGIIVSHDGAPKVLEFNCRFGDPEAQVVLPAADIELAEHLWSIATGDTWRPACSRVMAQRSAVTTVLASAGYPGKPAAGKVIQFPQELPDDTVLFHAGTRATAEGPIVTAGGRVLCATGLGPDVLAAAARSRALAEAVGFEGKTFRRDIAWREVARAGAA